MFKGLRALFVSGAIWNPMVLIGVVFGLWLGAKFDGEQISEIYQNYRLYLLALIIAAAYNFTLKRVYKNGGNELDWGVVLGHTITSVIKLVFSSLLAISFVVLISIT